MCVKMYSLTHGCYFLNACKAFKDRAGLYADKSSICFADLGQHEDVLVSDRS